MSEQITIRLDDRLVQHARLTAAASGSTLTEWVRGAIRRQAAQDTAMRARLEEDARAPLYTDEQEDVLLEYRARRAAATFTDPTGGFDR